ncbi:tetratricopeptide repeat-containing sensor histidine kinase [Tenuifilum sp.]|uniref:tetratricopeptide repeat-containing sensor histidine kinase n=1 Tax=Tenuifilum sp. TaxID=2760880 RepID=UPI002BBD78A1|nr:tetratricopeptide repeat protein [Tenuifilum sp.]
MKFRIVKAIALNIPLLLILFVAQSGFISAQDDLLEGVKPSSLEALAKVLERPDDSVKVVTLKLLCWENRNSDPDKAIEYGQMAVSLAKSLNLKMELSDSYNRLGIAYRNKGRYAQALECYFNGLEVSRTHGFDKHLAFQYNNLADLYNRLGLYGRALEFGKRAMEYAQKVNDDYTLAYIYNIMGTIYKNKNELDSALNCFTHSLELRQKIGYNQGIATSHLNIGSIELLREQYSKSLQSIQTAIDLYSPKNDLQGIAIAYYYKGQLYNKLGNFNNAIYCFDESLKYNESFKNLTVSRDCYNGLAYAYAKKKLFDKAYYFSSKATEINDSISLSQYVERLTQLTEALKYEETLNLQKEREKALAERLDFQRNIIKLYIAIIILLALIVGLVIYFYIKRAKDIRLLQAQRDEINMLNSTKDRFFSILAHDLKNQLTSIVTIAQMVKDKSLAIGDDGLIEFSKRLYALGFATNDLLENVLSWIKSQGKQVIARKSNIDLKEFIDRVILTQKPAAEIKSVAINNRVEPGISIHTDADMLSTVVRNLISNAIKFSSSGGRVDVFAFPKGNHVEISITDYGVGMPRETTDRLFNTLESLTQPGTMNEQGSGLGLIICNQLVTDLGGQIKVTSEPQRGSTFTVSLPHVS